MRVNKPFEWCWFFLAFLERTCHWGDKEGSFCPKIGIVVPKFAFERSFYREIGGFLDFFEEVPNAV